MEKEPLLLVPSSTLVPQEMRLELGPIPMCMIPLKGRPILDYISDRYSSLNPDCFVSTCEQREELENYLLKKDSSWTEITFQNSDSLAETVLKSLENIPNLEERYLYVNFADTLINPVKSSAKDLIYYDRVDYTSRWTSFTKNGEINSFTEKFSDFSSDSKHVFVGVFGISDAMKFRECLKSALNQETDKSRFYVALLDYIEDRDYELIKADSWTDVGHIDTYNEAKKDFLNTREFNNLSVDKKKNTITKESPDVEKLRPEIEWYDKIPSELKPYTPRIYRNSVSEEGAEIEMDYTGYPSLGELLLYGSHGIHIWKTIYSNLFEMFEEFQSYKKELSEDEIKNSLREMYLKKTERRLSRIKDKEEFSQYFDSETVKINGEEFKSAGYILENLDELLERNSLYHAENFTIIHGDPTFSNILYEVGSGVINLIDPRGEFGEFEIYGDTCYDLAKMRHSVSGKYDFIINDMFRIERDKDSVEYEVFTDEKHREREELFDNLLESEYGEKIDRIKGIEALLFLSMVPLHSDYPERQHYMISKGIELANDNLIGATE